MGNAIVVTSPHALIPAQIASAGADARRRFLEFFTANIRNRNTRAAYALAVSNFFRWCEARGLTELGRLEPVHVAAYVEQLGTSHAAPSVKQHLAAVRMLFDWLVVGQVVGSNPASVVRGPSHIVNRGRTPILSPEEAHQLFESIPTGSLVGLRDRALIGVLIYSFARISAALAMRVEDYFPQGKRWWLRLDEKGGKNHGRTRARARPSSITAPAMPSACTRSSGRAAGGQARGARAPCSPLTASFDVGVELLDLPIDRPPHLRVTAAPPARGLRSAGTGA